MKFIVFFFFFSDINKYLPGPHYDPPSKEKLLNMMEVSASTVVWFFFPSHMV